MSVIVRDSGFISEDYNGDWIDLPSDTAPETLAQYGNAAAIRIDFPTFAAGGVSGPAACQRPCHRRSIRDGAPFGV